MLSAAATRPSPTAPPCCPLRPGSYQVASPHQPLPSVWWEGHSQSDVAPARLLQVLACSHGQAATHVVCTLTPKCPSLLKCTFPKK